MRREATKGPVRSGLIGCGERILNDRQLLTHGEEEIKSQQVLHAACKSAGSGRMVRMP